MELCVALDLPSMEANLALVKKIKAYPVWLKVGLRSYIRDGAPFLKKLVLAVTALTSFSEEEFDDVYNASIAKTADKFAIDAHEAGLDGVVCSVFESASIKRMTSDDFITLTPGIRPFGEDAGDQQRVATIETAHEENADFIVVGRPIYQAEEPAYVVEKILERL
ncbi:MAG: orotidine-5'-phosphate decarboxylase [Campylobacterales bacterium]